MDYDDRWGRYRIRLTPIDFNQQLDLITEGLKQAFQEVSN